jgi:hypothetical protein
MSIRRELRVLRLLASLSSLLLLGVALAAFSQTTKPQNLGLGVLVDKLNAANAITNEAEQNAAIQAARSSAPPAPRRVFLGKGPDRSTSLQLADAQGRNRLTLRVDADGNASLEFLDEQGKVIQRLPQSK